MITGCETQSIEFYQCEKPYSFFFDFIPKFWKEKKYDNAIHRLCSLMRRMNVKSFCVEKLGKNDQIHEEFEAIKKRCDGKVRGDVLRISFFNEIINRIEDIPRNHQLCFLGYIIIINAELPDGCNKSYILQSVVRTPTIYNVENVSVPLSTMNLRMIGKYFNTNIGDKALKIYGSFYCQQNGLTHVCAHACLRMVLNNFKNRNLNLDNESINKLLQIDHMVTKYGKNGYSADEKFKSNFRAGLKIEDVERVLSHYGFRSIAHNFFDMPNLNYSDFIHPFIASGYPAMLSFTTASMSQHVVPIIGHTINTDIWYPEAKIHYVKLRDANYHPSTSWVDNFIFHDDNLGMYYSLPIRSLERVTIPTKDPQFRVYNALCILPGKVKNIPSEVQRYASALLSWLLHDNRKEDEKELVKILHRNRWILELVNQRKNSKRFPMIRTLLITKQAYINHLINMKDHDGNSYESNIIDHVKDLLKGARALWMNEISLPDLFSANKTKIGEIIFKAGKKDYEFFIVRMPGILLTNSSYGETNVTSHQSYFRFKHVSKNTMLEW